MSAAIGEYNEITDSQAILDDLPTTNKITLRISIKAGSITKDWIDNIVGRFNKGKVENCKFGVGNKNIVELKQFSKFDEIDVALTNKKHFDKLDFYDKLIKLNDEHSER